MIKSFSFPFVGNLGGYHLSQEHINKISRIQYQLSKQYLDKQDMYGNLFLTMQVNLVEGEPS